MSADRIEWKKEPSDTIVCFCHNVDKGRIVAAIRDGARDVREIHTATGAGFGGQCMDMNPRGRCCHSDIEELLKLHGEKE